MIVAQIKTPISTLQEEYLLQLRTMTAARTGLDIGTYEAQIQPSQPNSFSSISLSRGSTRNLELTDFRIQFEQEQGLAFDSNFLELALPLGIDVSQMGRTLLGIGAAA